MPYYEPVNNWLLWPGQPAYFVGGVGELAVNGRVILSLRLDTVLLIGPNDVVDVALATKMWEIKTVLDRQLWQSFITS